MEAKELMIGDWVKMRLPDNSYTEIAQLESVDAVLHGKLIAEPIPLTLEILIANGFEERYMDEEFNIFAFLNFAIYKRKENSSYLAKKIFSSACCCEFEIHYVHELQHALRLCGLT